MHAHAAAATATYRSRTAPPPPCPLSAARSSPARRRRSHRCNGPPAARPQPSPTDASLPAMPDCSATESRSQKKSRQKIRLTSRPANQARYEPVSLVRIGGEASSLSPNSSTPWWPARPRLRPPPAAIGSDTAEEAVDIALRSTDAARIERKTQSETSATRSADYRLSAEIKTAAFSRVNWRKYYATSFSFKTQQCRNACGSAHLG